MQHNGFDLPRFLKASAGQVVNKITGHGNAGGDQHLQCKFQKITIHLLNHPVLKE